MRVVSRGGCDIDIAGVPTVVSGEDYTDAVADDLWAPTSIMAGF